MLVSTAGGAQESRVRGGSQALATGLAARLADVRVACPVTAIEQDDAGVRVVHDGGELRREQVIVALPRRSQAGFATHPRCRRTVIISSRTARRAG